MNFTSKSLLNRWGTPALTNSTVRNHRAVKRRSTHLASDWYYDNTRPSCHESAPAPRAPKYVLDGTEYIPEDLSIVKEYFGNLYSDDVYEFCLVGDKETVAADLDEQGFSGVYPFVHYTDSDLRGQVGIPLPVKEAIRGVNESVSNPRNVFNTTDLGIHTGGLVKVSEIERLNELGYGLYSWSGIRTYALSGRVHNQRCFHPDTIMKLKNGKEVAIKELHVGDILVSGSTVEGTMWLNNVDSQGKIREKFYAIRNNEADREIYVTGFHFVKDTESNEFIHVMHASQSQYTDKLSPKLCCLITSDHRIVIGDQEFWDWEDDVMSNPENRKICLT